MQKESGKITIGGIIFHVETSGIELLSKYMKYPEIMRKQKAYENHLAEVFLRLLEKNREIITTRDIVRVLNNCDESEGDYKKHSEHQ